MSEGVKIEVEMGEPLNRLVCAVSWEWEGTEGATFVALGSDTPPTLRLKVEPVADPHGILAPPPATTEGEHR